MKEFKKWFQKEKIKYIYRPINEIDCGMGWKVALEEVLKQLNDIYSGDFENSDIVKWIEQELLNNQTDNNTD